MYLGVGIVDSYTQRDGVLEHPYVLWTSVLRRCYDPCYLAGKPSYKGCVVSEDWLVYSNFKRDVLIMKGYGLKDWQLDKDILSETDKVYSKETCCFVPREINQFFSSGRSKINSNLPKGISYDKSRSLYEAYGSIGGKKCFLGRYSNVEDAEKYVRVFKSERCLDLANKWRGMLDDRVYQAMLKYAFALLNI